MITIISFDKKEEYFLSCPICRFKFSWSIGRINEGFITCPNCGCEREGYRSINFERHWKTMGIIRIFVGDEFYTFIIDKITRCVLPNDLDEFYEVYYESERESKSDNLLNRFSLPQHFTKNHLFRSLEMISWRKRIVLVDRLTQFFEEYNVPVRY